MAAKNNHDAAKKAAVAVGVTAAALAAAGGYFLYGAKNAAQNRKKVQSWALKAKAEVLEGLEKAKELSQAEYEDMVDTVIKGYKSAKKGSVAELASLGKELKMHWKNIEKAGKKPVAKKSSPKKKAKSAE